jgi:hypothetical protein
VHNISRIAASEYSLLTSGLALAEQYRQESVQRPVIEIPTVSSFLAEASLGDGLAASRSKLAEMAMAKRKSKRD